MNSLDRQCDPVERLHWIYWAAAALLSRPLAALINTHYKTWGHGQYLPGLLSGRAYLAVNSQNLMTPSTTALLRCLFGPTLSLQAQLDFTTQTCFGCCVLEDSFRLVVSYWQQVDHWCSAVRPPTNPTHTQTHNSFFKLILVYICIISFKWCASIKSNVDWSQFHAVDASRPEIWHRMTSEAIGTHWLSVAPPTAGLPWSKHPVRNERLFWRPSQLDSPSWPLSVTIVVRQREKKNKNKPWRFFSTFQLSRRSF